MSERPEWMTRVRPALDAELPAWFAEFVPPPNPRRRSAVLMTFAEGDHGSDVILTERASTLRSHAAQVSFPGGHIDPGDDGAVGAALREAQEEVGLDPETVQVVSELPPLFMHPSQNAVTPVLAWWESPHPIGVVDEAEVARVIRADLDHLLDPANRFTVRAFDQYKGPGFEIDGLFVWGFTATLLTHVFDLAGLTRPWDTSRERLLPPAMLAPYLR